MVGLSSSAEIINFFESASEGGIKFHVEKNQFVIEYCPDNTCEKIIATKGMGERAFLNISLLYFKFASGYIYLKDWNQDALTADASLFAKDQIPDCRGLGGYDLTACALDWGRRAHNMRIYFTRYDERKKNTMQIFIKPGSKY